MVAVTVLSAASLALGAGGSDAAFPGKDGLIAFDGSRTGDDEIYTMHSDGTHRDSVTNNDAQDQWPTISPNGRTVIYASDRKSHQYDLYSSHLDGSHLRRLTKNPGGDLLGSFSPNGKRIVFESDRSFPSDIFVMNANGSHQRRLTHDTKFYDEFPVVSPNGKLIAFTRATPADLEYQICVMRSDGSHLRQLTHLPRDGYEPAFTPNGNRIVFETGGGIDVMHVDGSHRQKLIRTSKADFSPSVSPSGDLIVFVSAGFNSRTELRTAHIDGSHVRRLTDNKFNELNPNWGPR
jgi:Tol biopolymer transport system component